jgi:hypothetical protein
MPMELDLNNIRRSDCDINVTNLTMPMELDLNNIWRSDFDINVTNLTEQIELDVHLNNTVSGEVMVTSMSQI